MNKREYEEHQIKSCREQWFKNHKAHRHDYLAITNIGLPMEVINWLQPNTSNYATRYIISGRSLIVTGDIGDAVFEWGEEITFKFLNGCDLHYFAGKCRASPHGREFKQWDSDVAKAGVDELLNMWDAPSRAHEGFESAPLFSRGEFEHWLVSDCPEWADDPEMKSSLLNAGDVISCHCIGMWVGLKMAFEQIKGAA
jgi:hypothetical protein